MLIEGVNSNDAIKTRIAPIYTEEKLANGPVLFTNAKLAANHQTKEKAEGTAAVKAFNGAKDELHNNFVRLRHSVRYFFKSDVNMQNMVYLNEDIPGNYAQWSNLIERTLSVVMATPAITEKLSLVNISTDVLTGWQDDLMNIGQLKIVAEKEDGEAQAASVKKRETMAELKAYCSDLRECLNLFYHGSERQVLEQVGITVK
ncbi:hypothetical protein [Carboxylicivirga marina]|uniref:Uncharacterized protein n=1 Tax=Carboxylicivirga marina TaxID=2800988 RepID=A0ABS1HM41_9BACT|nr:hypothetical protein [Carboxylicivirga marina]MBK3518740.1 hypothetical protein [Carboxylicivirga marina]